MLVGTDHPLRDLDSMGATVDLSFAVLACDGLTLPPYRINVRIYVILACITSLCGMWPSKEDSADDREARWMRVEICVAKRVVVGGLPGLLPSLVDKVG